ncbi:hypothetical protein [Singulisphaera sp. PoT]|uniref:hypothetical protein n=1 Tax=Singulisphaera sp. PoT TaxID=3411797 RepID=UPI003BF59A2B
MKGGIAGKRQPDRSSQASSPEAEPKAENGAGWPPWAKALVSLALIFHIAAILAGALAASPSSELERSFAGLFATYHQVIDQGYSYRYYSPEPGPTAIAIAKIKFADGRPEQTVRLPERGVWPKIRYQRQLALANHLAEDFRMAQAAGQGNMSNWAHSYARHLAKEYKGSTEISLFLQSHLIPNIDHIRHELDERGSKGVDLDAEEFFTAPERIGDYQCDAL